MKTSVIFLVSLMCSVQLLFAQHISTDSSSSQTPPPPKVVVGEVNTSSQARDSTRWLQTDSASVKRKKHSPRKATLYSTFLPGLGQAYNHQYWKVPILYGIGAVCIYFIIDNHQNWQTYNDIYEKRVNNEIRSDYKTASFPDYDIYDVNNPLREVGKRTYSTANLRTLKDGYRRDRDFTIILLTLTYALNIVDAAVFAHLREFEVSEKLSMRVDPLIKYPLYNQPVLGLNCSLTFR